MMSDDSKAKKARKPPLSAFMPGQRKFQLSLLWKMYLWGLGICMGTGILLYFLSWSNVGRSVAQEATLRFPF
jgi:hypothetical protein